MIVVIVEISTMAVRHRSIGLALVLCLGSSIVSLAPTLAQTPPANVSQMSPEAILRAAANYLKTKPAFTFKNQITYDNILSGGDKVTYHATQTVYVQRNNRLRSSYDGDFQKTEVFYNGTTFTWLDVDQNMYFQAPAPNNLDDLIKTLNERQSSPIPMAAFVTSDAFSAYDPQNFTSRYLGLSTVNGQPSHNILVVGPESNWQIWVSADEQPLVQKVVITYKTLPGAPQYTAEFTSWEFPVSQPAQLFQFTPPANGIALQDASAVLKTPLPQGLNLPNGLTPPPPSSDIGGTNLNMPGGLTPPK